MYDAAISKEMDDIQQAAASLIERLSHALVHEEQDLRTDSLSGLKTARTIASLSVGDFDAHFLSDYLIQNRDFRDPRTNKPFTKEDLAILAKSIETTDASLAACLQTLQPASDLPISPVTSAVGYFENMISFAAAQLLTACEITEIHSGAILQSSIKDIWAFLKLCFAGLLSYQPLRAGAAALALQTKFAVAVHGADNPDMFIYEPFVLDVISASIVLLTKAVALCALKSNLKDSLAVVEAQRCPRIVFT